MKNNISSNKNENPREHRSPEEKDPVTDIRLPLMILFLTAATFTYVLELPEWITLTVAAIFAASWAFFRESSLILALLKNWRTPWTLVGPMAALFLYALLDMTIQTATSMVIDAGGLSQESLPSLLSWLLSLRAAAGDMSPMLLGIGGGIILGVGEELFWRGFIQTRLMLIVSHGMAVLMTAMVYGVFYLFILGPLAALLSLFLGMILSMLTLRSRSLIPGVLCHSVFLVLSLWLRPDITSFL